MMFLVGASNGTMLFPWIIGQLFSFSGPKGLMVGILRMLGESFAFAPRNESLAYFVCGKHNTLAWAAQTT